MEKVQKRIRLEKYAMEQVAKWRRIDNLLKSYCCLLDIEDAIICGDEEAIRQYVKEHKETKAVLLEQAKKLNIKYYGRLTKQELIDEIRTHQADTRKRQKFER